MTCNPTSLVKPEVGASEDTCNRAQAALVFSLTHVTALPDKLTACAGDDALATLAAMGLTQVEVDVAVYV